MTIDASKYLPHMGLNPRKVVCCAAANCQRSFPLAKGFPIEAIVGDELSIAFFCSAECYLNEVPLCCCARA